MTYPNESQVMKSLRHTLVSAIDETLEVVQQVFNDFYDYTGNQDDTIRELEKEIIELNARIAEPEGESHV